MPVHSRPPRLLLVSAASHSIGYGHLNRCLTLAAHAGAAAFEPAFLVFGDEQARVRVEAAGHACQVKPVSELERAALTAGVTEPADVVVSDVVHAALFARTPSVPALFGQLRRLGRVAVAIDSLGEQSLVAQAPQADIDLLVVPYAAAPIDRGQGRWRVLQGPQYALLSPAYAGLPRRLVRERADRVLVSCGGSDPDGNTALILRGLEKISGRMQVRAVLGPLFSEALRAEIRRLAEQSRHQVELVFAPETLLGAMLWCDVALSASGLTKYELAATGTPALLFSIDASHEEVNRPFAAQGSVLDLGLNITPECVREQTDKLLGDFARRAKMAATGQDMVDARGAQRLLAEIKKELSCSKTH